ncbi:zinc ABC transporter substrate-binding protein [Vibrio navarrensis]|uniref:High-affinity zinc uptake system protein ZnuA n=2 Tax=Vibrio navarrensis TaxID=29495 RepID=A0A099LST3_9VIBR|nr:zinc ABC transporter substrate-binding protein [Vibrio navarrensis]MBE4573624.1 zinc ABC transporter substrate-binding protein [Vibrio navarrensis]MBE4581089.1 zinc ABC transporter substrate-binding protein [Vibrio navarrensis]MBE4584576.1 zinc ABC transporter substrate-binding protein [Vibrio navarrensis]MBE4606478.1 zinc ABC transporter substrate-binding protein [Vibrio navarrensis]
MMMRAFLAGLLLILPTTAGAVEVLTSIKPIQMIVHELMLDVDKPDVLLASNASPHDYALRPSDMKKIRHADLVIWFGPGLEPFMEKLLESHPQVITIGAIKDIPLREYQDNHGHEGHNHGSYDPHFWLGVDVVEVAAKAISEKLMELDSAHQEIYQRNLTRFLTQLSSTDVQLKEQLSDVSKLGYFVFHDAYGYFESRYQLNNLGHFTVSPERKPGAKTLIQIRNRLAKGDVQCVFAEPQFTPAVVDTVIGNSPVNRGVLDPIGSKYTVENGSYFRFLNGLAGDYLQCLKQA